MEKVSVFDTATSGTVHLEPEQDSEIKMFVCGPTVQGPIHAGHARTYVFYDTLARLLSLLGVKVRFVINITDIDEKIRDVALSKGVTPEEYAEEQVSGFIRNMEQLRIKSVSSLERVSKHVGDIIDYVKLLIENGFAYERDGYVFFDTSKQNSFGYLSHLPMEEIILRPVELNEKKRNMLDFSLWRPIKVTSKDIESPWGAGSPGWHIQDTAIALKVFIKGYDLHGGAYELIYPHHEALITIIKAITGRTSFVRHWVHTHLLRIEGKKMSKSEGNVVTVNSLLERYSPSKLRFALLSKHYRKDMNYEDIEKAAKLYERMRKRMPSEGSEPSRELLRMVVSDVDTETVVKRMEYISSSGSQEEKREAVAFAEHVLGVGFE
jgi:cysteinyl-tRNA synthetase